MENRTLEEWLPEHEISKPTAMAMQNCHGKLVVGPLKNVRWPSVWS